LPSFEFSQPAWELEVLHSVAHVANLTGQHEAAIGRYQEALELHQKVGVAVNKGSWLGTIADASPGLGRYQQAAETLSAALPMFRGHFMRRYQALCLLKLGYAHQAMGDYREAIINVAESLSIFRELRLAHYEERALRTIDACRGQLQSKGTPASALVARLDHNAKSTSR
jgi:tetratricopeptide (TPR) repeat protein